MAENTEQYTPTDEEVRLDYIAAYTDQQSSQLLAGMAFDRFLTAHDARVKAEALTEAGDPLVQMSRLIDDGNAHRDPEAITWGRLAKITEEAGEVIAAYIGATGQNPRKGVTHEVDEVRAELLDVAVTALGAYEHLDGHRGRALPALAEKVAHVAARLRVTNSDQQGQS